MEQRSRSRRNPTTKNGRKQTRPFPIQHPNRIDNGLIMRPAYTGQPCFATKIMSDPIKLTTTVTTGQIANTTTITNALITNFATRFAGMWDEYRIIKCRAIVVCFSSTNPGQMNHWFDEPSTAGAAPAIADARKNRCLRFNASDTGKPHQMTLTPHDPTLQQWNDTAVGLTIGVYKMYTDNANYGSSIVATDYCTVQFDLTIQFRGFK